MKIEAGKAYKTRGGLKAFVKFEIPEPVYRDDEDRFCGYVENEAYNEFCLWSASGKDGLFYLESEDDLIEEWKE